jgi:hypothetical protein
MYCLRSLGSRDRGFESHSRHGCLVCVCVYVVLCLGRGDKLITRPKSPTVYKNDHKSEKSALCSKMSANGEKNIPIHEKGVSEITCALFTTVVPQCGSLIQSMFEIEFRLQQARCYSGNAIQLYSGGVLFESSSGTSSTHWGSYNFPHLLQPYISIPILPSSLFNINVTVLPYTDLDSDNVKETTARTDIEGFEN